MPTGELTIFAVAISTIVAIAVTMIAMRRRWLNHLPDCQVALREATSVHKQIVARADKAYRREAKYHAGLVSDRQRRLESAQQYGRELLGCAGSTFVAYEHQLRTEHGVFPMEGSVRAYTDGSGDLYVDRRTTATRMAAGAYIGGTAGMVAGGMLRKKEYHDTRELYFIVESDYFYTAVPCSPDSSQHLMRLASDVNMAAKRVEFNAVERERLTAISQRDLEEAVDATGWVDATLASLQAAEADTGLVDRCQAACDGAIPFDGLEAVEEEIAAWEADWGEHSASSRAAGRGGYARHAKRELPAAGAIDPQ